MNNTNFKRAFIKIHDNAYNFVQKFFTEKLEFFEHIKNLGYQCNETERFVYIGIGDTTKGIGNYLDVCMLLANELKKSQYIAMQKKLGFPDPDREFPDPKI